MKKKREVWMNVSEVAYRLGVSERRVRQFIQGGRLPARYYSRVWLVKEKDCNDFAKLPRKAGRPWGKE